MSAGRTITFLLWDFGYTLAHRSPGLDTVLLESIREIVPSMRIEASEIRDFAKGIFPWERAEEEHSHISTGQAWWNDISTRLESRLRDYGVNISQPMELAERIKRAYLDSRYWVVWEDVAPTLEALAAKGYQHVIASNHVPELSELIFSLKLPYFERVFTSALVGYEKPRIEFFERVLQEIGSQQCCMIGDNTRSDILPAESVGIPAILVRNLSASVKYNVDSLWEVPEVIERLQMTG